ncbi:MAG: D-alanyl-D-alanine carboxypeptidase/D-alanyl-D-alanine-endopeptidase [Pseudomonadota bacterium]
MTINDSPPVRPASRPASWQVLLTAIGLLIAGHAPGADVADARVSDGPEAARLPTQVGRVLDALKLGDETLSVYVAPLDGGDPVMAWNADTPRNPASAVKLVTTLAAIEVLGPAYRWETEAYTLGPLDDGTLDGDLILRGGGDPFMTAERFWSFLRGLRARGVERIAGDLVIDASYFDVIPEDPRAFDGEPYRSYNVQPHALLLNFKTVSFQFFPDGKAVRVVPDPPLANLTLDNRLRTANKACRGFQRGVAFNLPNGFDDGTVVFSGTFPARCRAYSLSRTVLTPEQFAWGLFSSLWREIGGEFDGTVRIGDAPEDERPLFTMRSPTLAEIVRSVNKHSNNVMTRHLLYTMGAQVEGEPGTEDNGKRAIDGWLTENGLELDSLRLDNGAGLSRDTRISARDMVTLLRYGWQSPYSAEFIASMPLAGLDGTLRKRFKDEPLEGQMHLKTGSLDHVVALAGYVRSRAGRHYAVAIMHNEEDVHRGTGQQVQDALLRWVYRL